ncbi:MAG TPA: hypothetical protein VGK19_24470 [Capsulimonadaceae bacterium]
MKRYDHEAKVSTAANTVCWLPEESYPGAPGGLLSRRVNLTATAIG